MEKVMLGDLTYPHVHVDSSARHLDAALLRLDLTKELAQLEGAESWRLHGHSAKTLMRYADLRVVLIAMKAGFSLGQHETKGRLTIQVLKGQVTLKLKEQTAVLDAGSLFGLAPRIGHDVEALEASAILLTLGWPIPAAS